MKDLEQRFLKVELRAFGSIDDDGDDDFAIEGYGATYNTESTDPNLGFREVVGPSAFARSLREGADVRCLFNHDPNVVLGRTSSRTLQLRSDSRGLFYRAQLDRSNPQHASVHAMIKRQDISSCSFGFVAQKDAWTHKRDADGNLYAQRTLLDVDLVDVSPVTYPAYDSTSVTARMAAMFPNGVPKEVETRMKLARVLKEGSLSTEELLEELRSSKL